jgi:hypothetical protein
VAVRSAPDESQSRLDRRTRTLCRLCSSCEIRASPSARSHTISTRMATPRALDKIGIRRRCGGSWSVAGPRTSTATVGFSGREQATKELPLGGKRRFPTTRIYGPNPPGVGIDCGVVPTRHERTAPVDLLACLASLWAEGRTNSRECNGSKRKRPSGQANARAGRWTARRGLRFGRKGPLPKLGMTCVSPRRCGFRRSCLSAFVAPLSWRSTPPAA